MTVFCLLFGKHSACVITRTLGQPGSMQQGMRLLFAGGMVVGGAVVASVYQAIGWIRENRIKSTEGTRDDQVIDTDMRPVMKTEEIKECTVTGFVCYSDDTEFTPGEKLEVVGSAEKGLLINKEHGPCNPYFITKEMLASISDYHCSG